MNNRGSILNGYKTREETHYKNRRGEINNVGLTDGKKAPYMKGRHEEANKGKEPINFCLGSDDYNALVDYCKHHNIKRSELLSRWIKSTCKDFYLN